MIKDCIYCTRFEQKCPKFIQILEEAQFFDPSTVYDRVHAKVQNCKEFEERI